MKTYIPVIFLVCVLVIIAHKSIFHQTETAVAPQNAGSAEGDISRVAEAGKGKVLLHFWKPHCPPCEFMEPIIAQTERECPTIKMVHINTDLPENRAIHDRYQIAYTPTFVLLENGRILARSIGAFRDKTAFMSFLRPSKMY
jgi:thiol-disulfide isomerase/thioredoxin